MNIEIDGIGIGASPGTTVLDACLRAGVRLPHSCRAGSCRSCALTRLDGEEHELLACQTRVESGMRLRSRQGALSRVPAELTGREWLSKDVLRVLLKPRAEFTWRAGQYLFLSRGPELSRCYSIASPTQLELHVRVLPRGRMSGWLAEEARVGDSLELQGPLGDCVYRPENPDEPLLLAGTGTGLAPLLGVVRDAQSHGHRGPILLLHGAARQTGLYWNLGSGELTGIATESWCLEPGAGPGIRCGSLAERVISIGERLAAMRIYLCGAPEFVGQLQQACFLEGASLERIHTDPFLAAAQ